MSDALVQRVHGQLRARGERMTAPRAAVLRALSAQAGHLSADEIQAAVADDIGPIHATSIYRTLEALSNLGVVQHIHLGHGATAYHLTDVIGAHLHAQCRICGEVLDLPPDLLDGVADRLAERHGFALDPTHAALSGVCAPCSAPAGPATDP